MNFEDLQTMAKVLNHSKLELQCLNIAIDGTNRGNFTLKNKCALTKEQIERTIYLFNGYWEEIQLIEEFK